MMKQWKRMLAWFMAAVTVGSVGVAAESEDVPTYELVRFSSFERDFNDETGDLLYGDTLYANWTRADGIDGDGGYDVETAYPGRENLRLKVTLALSSTDPSVDPDIAWDGITVKLRSPDVENKEGDPNLKENGGNDDTNKEHNYGWNIKPETVDMQDGRLELSIPLDRPADTSRGLMDWTMVQRIILTMRIKDGLVSEGLATTMSMTLSEVMIVNDVMQITRDRVLHAAENAFLTASDYREDTVQAFTETREQALALVENDAATLPQLQDMLAALQTARQQMVEVTYAVADFSRLCGVYPGEDDHTLYADWVYAREAGDGEGIDLTTHEWSQLMLQVEFTLTGPEGYDGVWNTDGWLLLRSADTEQKRTYGWQLTNTDIGIGTMKAGVNRLSIPLDAVDGYTVLQSAAAIDWTAINRLQMYIQPEDYQKGDFSLTVTMARIVDVTRPTQALVDLNEALDAPVPEESLYTEETWQVYAAARQEAETAKADYVYWTADDLGAAATALQTAAEGLVEKPLYTPGDVDNSGEVEANDALQVLQAATGKITLSDTTALAADVDGETGLSANDALMILQYATQKIGSFPVEE